MALPFLILSTAADRRLALADGPSHYRPSGSGRTLSAALAIGIAGGVGATLMLALVVPAIIDQPPGTFVTRNIPLPKPADPVIEPVPQPQEVRERTVTTVDPLVRLPQLTDTRMTLPPTLPDYGDVTVDPGRGLGTGIVRPVDPPPAPLFVDAVRDPRFARSFQPAYPPALERQEIEGRCPVSVTVAPTGRVSAIRDNGCAHELFFNSTRRQALSDWRFRPATRDGIAVESTQTLTVTFRIDR